MWCDSSWLNFSSPSLSYALLRSHNTLTFRSLKCYALRQMSHLDCRVYPDRLTHKEPPTLTGSTLTPASKKLKKAEWDSYAHYQVAFFRGEIGVVLVSCRFHAHLTLRTGTSRQPEWNPHVSREIVNILSFIIFHDLRLCDYTILCLVRVPPINQRLAAFTPALIFACCVNFCMLS